MSNCTFLFNGTEYPYFRHPANNTRVNERRVEIPIIQRYVEGKPGPILEVGNVLGQYIDRRWTTVDLTEEGEGVLNCDILAWQGGPYKLIVSISTFEHIGLDYGATPFTAIDAIRHCSDLLAPGGRLVFTVPIGYNPALDEWLMNDWAGTLSYLKRVSIGNRWAQVDRDAVKDAKYGEPYKYGNALIIGEYVRPASV